MPLSGTTFNRILISVIGALLATLHFVRVRWFLLHFSFSVTTVNDSYTNTGHQLTLKDCHRDLGLVFSNKLYMVCILYCAIAANCTIGLIRTTFSISSYVHCCKLLYLSLVRLVLTNCSSSSVWRPHLCENIIELEKNYQHATKCTYT